MIVLGLAGVEFSFTGVSVAVCEQAAMVLAGVKPPQLPVLKSASLVPPELVFLKASSWAVDVRVLN